MDVPGPDSDWRSPAFRLKVVAQIDEAMRKAGTAHTKSSTDMESHVFMKAKTREDYLSLVARLIIHFRDIHNKAQGGPDPINALQNMAGVGGGGPGFIGPRPPGAPMGAMGQMQMGQHGMQGVAGGQQAGEFNNSGPDSDWRNPAFRHKVVAQIDEAMRKAGTAHTKSSTDMESHVFMKAKTREDYLSLVARLIIHFRDIHKKAQGGPDPINALQNIPGVGGGGPGFIGPRPPGAPMGAMGPMQMGQHGMQGVVWGQQADYRILEVTDAMGQMQMCQHGMQGVSGGQQAGGTAGPMQMMSQQPLQFQPFQMQQPQPQNAGHQHSSNNYN